MAKTIKFNLICDNKPVRTIEDLQNNFSVEDIWEYYENGLLKKWLSVRGYAEEVEKIEKIVSVEPSQIIVSLIQIFGIESDEKKIKEDIYFLSYQKRRNEQIAAYVEKGKKAYEIINSDIEEFNTLIEQLVNYKGAAQIKACIKKLVINYEWLLRMNSRKLFFLLKEKDNWLAIMNLLMNEKTREYYIPSEEDECGEPILWGLHSFYKAMDITSDQENKDIKDMYNLICYEIKNLSFMEKLGESLKKFSGRTDEYWKDLEPKGKKYMILRMEGGNFVRSAGKIGEDLGVSNINNKFLILDGIDYKSNNAAQTLYYMEV